MMTTDEAVELDMMQLFAGDGEIDLNDDGEIDLNDIFPPGSLGGDVLPPGTLTDVFGTSFDGVSPNGVDDLGSATRTTATTSGAAVSTTCNT